MKKNYNKRMIQKKGYGLAKSIFALTDNMNEKRMKKLSAQMRDDVIIIPANISEGNARKTWKNASRYFIVARGFLNRLDAHLERSRSLGMIKANDYKKIGTQIQTIDLMLAGLLQRKKEKK